jgi:ribosomal protein S18 acetylase RimI-like enzyme
VLASSVSYFTRPGQAVDASKVAALHDLSRRAYYVEGGISVPEYEDDRVLWWASQLSSPRRVSRVAVEGETVVGVMLAGQRIFDGAVEYELDGLYVLPSSWSTGVGTALHQEFLATFLSSGAESARLQVWNGNSRAIHFYEARGWHRTGRIREASAGVSFDEMVLSP